MSHSEVSHFPGLRHRLVLSVKTMMVTPRIESLNSSSTSSLNNINGTSCYNNDASSFTLVIIFILLGILGAFGNFMVILVVWKNRPMQNPTNFLLTNIATSNLIFLLTASPRYIVLILAMYVQPMPFKYGIHMKTLLHVPSLISTFTVTLLAIERYNALVHPMKINRRLSKRTAKLFIVVIWLMSTILALPISIEHESSRSKSAFYAPILFLIFSGVPAIVVTFCYSKIIIGIYVVKNVCSESNVRPQDAKDKKKLVKMLLLITLMSMILNLPTVAYAFVELVGSSLPCHYWIALALPHYLSPCLNPILYIMYISNYREGVMRLLRCLCARN